MRHSTKSTRTVRRSNLCEHKQESSDSPTVAVEDSLLVLTVTDVVLLLWLSLLLNLLLLFVGLDFNLRVDGATDDLRPLTRLPQSDGQVFGSVGFQQRHFGLSLLRKFLSGQS